MSKNCREKIMEYFSKKITCWGTVQYSQIIGPSTSIICGSSVIPDNNYFFWGLKISDSSNMTLPAVLFSPLPVRPADHPSPHPFHHIHPNHPVGSRGGRRVHLIGILACHFSHISDVFISWPWQMAATTGSKLRESYMKQIDSTDTRL